MKTVLGNRQQRAHVTLLAENFINTVNEEMRMQWRAHCMALFGELWMREMEARKLCAN